MRLNLIFLVVLLISFLVLAGYSFSVSYTDFINPKNCTQTWGFSCNSTFNDASNTNDGTACSGNRTGYMDSVEEVYINVSAVRPSNPINATCQFYEHGHGTGDITYENIFYYNNSNWTTLYSNSFESGSTAVTSNRSVVFNVNSTEGTHIVRCSISYRYSIDNYCASGPYYDNDDVNFIVVIPLAYDYWNITFANGTEIPNGTTLTRNDNVTVAAHWNKSISYAVAEINGTGIFNNYTISNFTGNWTNYTINLSDATKYNQYNIITVKAIYANDSVGAWGFNKTSPLLYFYLDIGSEPPNISSYWLQPLTNRTNLYTNLTIYANVSDDSGISTVRANLTYPSNTSVILNLTGDPNPGNRTWNYTFRTTGFTLNETGNYTVSWVSVKDNGNREVNLTQNLTFYVTNNMNASVSVSPSTPSKTQQLTVSINIYDTNNNFHQFPVNLTISCLNMSFQTYNFSLTNISYQTSTTNCYAPDSYITSFNITVNATDQYNNHNYTVITLTTQSSGGDTIISGGGGGGGGGGNVTIIQNVTVNATTEIRDFNFTVQTEEVQVYRGEDATILGSVSNKGNTMLTLSSSIILNSTCCVVSITPSEFKLKVGGAENPFTVSIHVNTSTEPNKEYFADIKLKSEALEKSKRIKIIVKENPVISSLQQASGQVSDIEEKIKEYKKVGLNIVDLEGLLNRIKETLSGSQTKINKDDINTLKNDENSVKLSLSQINDQLNKLAFVKAVYQNKWNITSGIIITFISTYLVSQVIYPHFKLGKEIKALAEEEESLIKTRKETEKQYFMRKIDEQTFTSIMIEKQGKILKMRADIKRKDEDRSSLMRQRLHPISMLRWMKNGFTKIPKIFKRKPRDIQTS